MEQPGSDSEDSGSEDEDTSIEFLYLELLDESDEPEEPKAAAPPSTPAAATDGAATPGSILATVATWAQRAAEDLRGSLGNLSEQILSIDWSFLSVGIRDDRMSAR